MALSKGTIIPIYKKGDPSNPTNYRGINNVNTMAKLFSLLLRVRINKWCETNSVFNDSQYGFRDNCSAADAVFILHTSIQNILATSKTLWCIFIDYERAFDTVNRDALWAKLISTG